MHEDLQQACHAAMAVPREEAGARALDSSWAQAAKSFTHFLVPARSARGFGTDGQAFVTGPSSRSGTLS